MTSLQNLLILSNAFDIKNDDGMIDIIISAMWSAMKNDKVIGITAAAVIILYSFSMICDIELLLYQTTAILNDTRMIYKR